MPRTPQLAAAVAEVEIDDVEEAKAARKAAKRAAKEAAASGAEAVEEQAESDDAAAKAARKAAKKAAKEAAAAAEAEAGEEEDAAAKKSAKKLAKKVAEEAEEDDEEARKAAKKAAKKAAREAAEATAAEATAAESKPAKKRNSAESEEGSTTAASPEQKRRKGEEGSDADLSVDAFRESHQIIVEAGCPDPFQTFAAAGQVLGKDLNKALLAQGYERPTPIQAQAWPIALSGKDLVAVAKTGSGKTCGFLLPALARICERGPVSPPKRQGYYTEAAKPTVLVLAPTRELAQQIAVEAERFAPVAKARVVTIYGGVPKGDQVRELRLGADVLIATPGRLLDFCKGDPSRDLKPSIDLGKVNYLVLDEADRMLDMGFSDDIRNVVSQCPATGKPSEAGGATGPSSGTKRQTLFFTATWPKDVRATAASLTSQDAVQVRIGQGADGDTLTANKNVLQRVEVMEDHQKFGRLIEVLENDLKGGETAIVFAAQKITCDDLEQDLQRKFTSAGLGRGMWCKAIHSGKDQWVRDEALAKFRELTAAPKASQRGILVATDVAARGLDIPGVAMVIVYDFGRGFNAQNGGVESYVHRIGRTGRAGRKGRAVTFYTSEDNGAVELAELLKGAEQEVPAALAEIADDEANNRWYKKSYRKGGGKGKGKGKGKGGGKGGKGKGKSKGGRGW